MKAEQSELEVQMENRFYSEDNLSKLCAEGAVRNLMNMLHCLRAELDSFWEMATMNVQETQFVLKDMLNDKKVPNGVIKGNLEVDSIEKCLWIPQKKFHFAATKPLNTSSFQCVKQSLKALLEIKFPVIILVQAQCATYNHVVVIWRKMAIDYESKYIYPLTDVILLPHFSGLFVGVASFHRGKFATHQRMCISKIGVHQNITNQEVLLENISSKPIIG
jgi:hypothetical protein